MKLLLVGDSHCRELNEIFAELTSSITTYTVFVPRNINTITLKYRTEIQSINAFRPDVIVIHLGHNDLCYHSVCNQQPMSIDEFMGILETFLLKIRIDFPQSRIMYSSLLPRSVGPRMGFAQHLLYNLMAISFADQARARLNSLGYDFVSNESLWYSKQEGIEHPIFFGADGLHLRAVGQEFVARGWIEALEGLLGKHQR